MTARIISIDGRIELRITAESNYPTESGYRCYELSPQTLRSIYRDAHTIMMEITDGLNKSYGSNHGTPQGKGQS